MNEIKELEEIEKELENPEIEIIKKRIKEELEGLERLEKEIKIEKLKKNNKK